MRSSRRDTERVGKVTGAKDHGVLKEVYTQQEFEPQMAHINGRPRDAGLGGPGPGRWRHESPPPGGCRFP